MKGPSNVLDAKNVSDNLLTCKTICEYIAGKNPTKVPIVKNVSESPQI